MQNFGIKELQQSMQRSMNNMDLTGRLFRSAVSGQEIWEMYINGLENDPVFRDPESSEHNCNLCNNFIRRYGNIVGVNADGELMTLWDNVPAGNEYTGMADAIEEKLKTSPIADIFIETYASLNSLNYEKCRKDNAVFRLGIDKNVKRYTKEEAEKFGVVKPNEIRTFDHLHMDIPARFVDQTGKSTEAIQSEYRSAKEVFKRGLDTISTDTLQLVKDLIQQGSILDGEAHLSKLRSMISFSEQYKDVPAHKKDIWAWVNSHNLPIAKFRNELIGVLCTELSEGMELNEACKNWNKRVDPANYMKATAPITKKQIAEAQKFVEENGYEDSFNRRHATIDDIKVSEILHANAGDGTVAKVSIFDGVKASATRHKRSEFKGVEEVGIEKFMKDILPGCSSVEVFLTAAHEGNLVSLTTPADPDSKPIFKWGNNYSWTYKGGLAGKSRIQQAVLEKGGIVEAPFRASLMWNESGKDTSDLDLHVAQPDGMAIYYMTEYRRDQNPDCFSSCGGQLDLDNTNPGDKLGVENIYFPDLSRMKDGKYDIYVDQYYARNSQGFKLEIAMGEDVYTYSYDRPLSRKVLVATVTYRNGEFRISHALTPTEGETTTKEIYGLETGRFHKVNLVCLSPNHWGENAVGNKHYFFMLEGCRTEEEIRGFHVENLSGDMLKHRKVMEVLGNTVKVAPTEKQLSGLGFNATVRDEVIVKLGGTHKRVIKIKF